MKNSYFVLCFALLFACKKEEKSPIQPAPNPVAVSLVNLWELQISISNMYINSSLANGDTTIPAPNEIWVKFNNNNSYIEYQNTVPTDTGIYTYTNNLLTIMSDLDTIEYSTTISATSLNLYNVQIDLSNLPDTTKFETKLTFRKI